MAAITTATGFDIAGMMLGLASSVVLLVWSIRLGPLQRSLAKLDVIPPESPLTEVGEILSSKLRQQVADILEKEILYLGSSAVLLGLSFTAGIIAKLI